MIEHNSSLAAHQSKSAVLWCNCTRDSDASYIKKAQSARAQRINGPYKHACHCTRCCTNAKCSGDAQQAQCAPARHQRCWLEVALQEHQTDDPNAHAHIFSMEDGPRVPQNPLAPVFAQVTRMRARGDGAPIPPATFPFMEGAGQHLRELCQRSCQHHFVEHQVMAMRAQRQTCLQWGSASNKSGTAVTPVVSTTTAAVAKQPDAEESVQSKLLNSIFPAYLLLEIVGESRGARGYRLKESDVDMSIAGNEELVGMYVYYPCFPSYIKANINGFKPEHYLGHSDPRVLDDMNNDDRKVADYARKTQLLDMCHIGLLCRDKQYAEPLAQLRAQNILKVSPPPLDELVYFYIDVFKFHKATRNMIEVLLVAPVRRALLDVAARPMIMCNAPDGSSTCLAEDQEPAPNACTDEQQRQYEQLREKAGFGRTIARAENGSTLQVPLLPFWYAKSGARQWLSFFGNYRQEQKHTWGDTPHQFHSGSACSVQHLLEPQQQQSLSLQPTVTDIVVATTTVADSTPVTMSIDFTKLQSQDRRDGGGCYVISTLVQKVYEVDGKTLSELTELAVAERDELPQKIAKVTSNRAKLEKAGSPPEDLIKFTKAIAALQDRGQKLDQDLLGTYVRLNTGSGKSLNAYEADPATIARLAASSLSASADDTMDMDELDAIVNDNELVADSDVVAVKEAPAAVEPERRALTRDEKLVAKFAGLSAKKYEALRTHHKKDVEAQRAHYARVLAKYGLGHKKTDCAYNVMRESERALEKFSKKGKSKDTFIDDSEATEEHKLLEVDEDEDDDYEEDDDEADDDDDEHDSGDEEPSDAESLGNSEDERDDDLRDDVVESSDEAASGDSDAESEREQHDDEENNDGDDDEDDEDGNRVAKLFANKRKKQQGRAPKVSKRKASEVDESHAADKRVRTDASTKASAVPAASKDPIKGIADKFEAPSKPVPVPSKSVAARFESAEPTPSPPSKAIQCRVEVVSADPIALDDGDNDDDCQPDPMEEDHDAVGVQRMPYTTSATSALVQGSAGDVASSTPQKSGKSKPKSDAPSSDAEDGKQAPAKSKPKSTPQWTDEDYKLAGSSRAEYSTLVGTAKASVTRKLKANANLKAKESEALEDVQVCEKSDKDNEKKKHKKDKEHKKDKKHHKKEAEDSGASGAAAPPKPRAGKSKCVFKQPAVEKEMSPEEKKIFLANYANWCGQFEEFMMGNLKIKFDNERDSTADMDYDELKKHFKKTMPGDWKDEAAFKVAQKHYNLLELMFSKDGWTSDRKRFADFVTLPQTIKEVMNFLKVVYYHVDCPNVPEVFRPYTRKALLDERKPSKPVWAVDF